MFQPKRTKFRKYQKIQIGGIVGNQNDLSFGDFAIVAIEPGLISARCLEATRRTLTRKMKRSGQLWCRVFPSIAVSRKPAETRMGKGKGNPEFWSCDIPAGQILFELSGVAPEIAIQAIRSASYKLPLLTRRIERGNFQGALRND
jgi:large subunit ribosomal protein L16